MKILIITMLIGLLGYAISKPLDTKDATDALVEIEKQKLIKFPEEVEKQKIPEGKEQHDDAQRILLEIEKINQSLGYIRKQADQTKSPTVLDSSQYLFPNAGYQPFHTHSSQAMSVNGETILLPSIRSVNIEPSYFNTANVNDAAAARKYQKLNAATSTKNAFHIKPQRGEWHAEHKNGEDTILPTHFVIPVDLYEHNKQYLDKKNTPDYKIKGYKIVGDIDHFYGKMKANKTSHGSKVNPLPNYHLFFLSQDNAAKNSLKNIKAIPSGTKESSSREEKLAHRPYKIQTNTQALTNGNTVNSTSSSQIVKKRLVPKKGVGNTNSVVSASSSTVVKLQPPVHGNGEQQQTHQQQQTQQQQLQQQTHQQQQTQQQQLQHHLQKPLSGQQITQIIQPPEVTPSYTVLNTQAVKPINSNNNQINQHPIRHLLNTQNNNNNAMKKRPLLELQNNINSINNATSNAIKNAFQNIFKIPFRQNETMNPSTVTEYTPMVAMPLPMPEHAQAQLQHQQQFHAGSNNANLQPFYVEGNFANDHLDSDYKWDDENANVESYNSDYQDSSNNSQESLEPEEKNIFSNLMKQKHETQKEALKQGGIIIQRLKVRKGGIAIAGPGGVATAGSGGTAIVGPGGYALTHPRSLTIAGPGAKIIAIPSKIDLKDALQRTNLDLQTFPREGRIVATGPTVYYAPPTGDYLEI